jgi:peptidoglycan/LPS O-acetylase OafA/YrhL
MRAPDRLYALDALRGFAAVAVVLFHWQFWGQDPNPVQDALGNAVRTFFYQCGIAAVGLFFTLSGFIFYWLFRTPIQERTVGGRWFFVDRFSRLYPLYFLTLLWAWGGHNLYAWMNQGSNWSSGVNDFAGFLRQLFVFPLWTPKRVIGFNLPAWSLAVEALMYLLFFVLARRSLLGFAGTLVMLLLALPMQLYSADIAYGMTSFFMGGMCWLALGRVEAMWPERVLRLVVIVSWLSTIVFGSGIINLALTPLAFLDHFYAMYVLFPATVLYLAILETRKGPIARGARWFGDVTYAIYLLHFPLMLTTAILFRAIGGNFQALRSPLSLAIFLLVLIPLALATHRFFERPVQQWIRRRFSGRPPLDNAPPTSIAAVQTETSSAR